MKNSKIAILGTSFAFVLLLAGQAAPTQNSSSTWMQHYYQAPNPAEVVSAVRSMSASGAFEQAGEPATSIGFLSVVFAQNPERAGEWVAELRDLPAAHRRLVAAALWYSGVPSGDRELRLLSREASPELRAELDALLAAGPQPIRNTPVLSESSLNLQWGAFLASGEPQYIVNALAALGSGEHGLSSAARYSLAQKAAEHTRVYETCQAQLSRQPENVREQLRAALTNVRR